MYGNECEEQGLETTFIYNFLDMHASTVNVVVKWQKFRKSVLTGEVIDYFAASVDVDCWVWRCETEVEH